MIPGHIHEYLQRSGASYEPLTHSRAVRAQELAASLHVSGKRVAKAVVVDADFESEHETWLAVLPASSRVDIDRLRRGLEARQVSILGEAQFSMRFRDCEVGAEPPFGRLYKMPVVIDGSLTGDKRIVFRAGSHTEAIEMSYETYAKLESPRVVDFAVPAD